MFSVLMSLYNKEKPQNLDECLKSILVQTMKPTEIILVYDGVINRDLDVIVSNYKDILNIKVVQIEKNVGLGRALQHGLGYCTYDIVARMDTDDICLPQRFEKQIPIVFDDEELAILGSSVIEFDENNNERIKSLPESNEEIKKFCKLKNPFNHMSVVFRKNKVNEVGGYVHHLFMEDYNLWLRMIATGMKVKNINEVLLRVRSGSEMVSKRRGWNYIKSEFILLKLKIRLKIASIIICFLSFLIRSASRLIPLKLLLFLYNNDRKAS